METPRIGIHSGSPEGAGNGEDNSATTNPIGSAVGDLAKEGLAQAKELGSKSLERVAKEADGWRHTAAKELEDFAGVVDDAAAKVDLGELGGKLAAGASRLVRNVSRNIGESTPKQLLQTAQRFARERPGLFMAGCLALGFLFARVMRTS